MNKRDKQFFSDLAHEDNIGLVLRGHLHVEHQLIRFISNQLLYPERIDWGKINYSGKVELALACGLDIDIHPGLAYLETLRNRFASSLNAAIDSNWVLNAYIGLPQSIKNDVELAYKGLGKRIDDETATLDTRNLLVLIFLCVANAVKALVESEPKKVCKVKKSRKK